MPTGAVYAKIRVAIAGAGLMGRWHACYAKRCGAAVAGIVDRDEHAANRLAARFPEARVFTELATMLRDAHPDVLHICTPSPTHDAIATAAMNAGVHVLVEKPLAASAGETETLLDLADNRGVRICPVHQFSFQAGALRAAEWIPTLGQVLHTQAVFCSAGGEGATNLDDIAGEILIHPLSLMASLLPGNLNQQDWSVARPLPGEMRIFGRQGGTSSSILISLNGRPTECSFQIFASNGNVYMDLFHGFAVMEGPAVSTRRKILHPFETAGRRFFAAGLNLARRTVAREAAYPGLRRLIERFYSTISQNQPSPITRQQILEVARARDAIVSSAAAHD